MHEPTRGSLPLIAAILALTAAGVVFGSSSVVQPRHDCREDATVDGLRRPGLEKDCNRNGIADDCETMLGFEPMAILVDGVELKVVVAADVNGDLVEDYVYAAGDPADLVAWSSVGSSRETVVFEGETTRLWPADLDGDGDVDVVSNGRYPREVVWHENLDGAGLAWRDHTISDGHYFRVSSVAAGDVDGDGDPDVVVGLSFFDELVVWFENEDGAGAFGPPITIAESEGLRVSLVDMDGNRAADVVWRNEDGVWWSRNGGNGAFGPPEVIVPPMDYNWPLAIGDVDGDRDPDVVVGSRQKVAWIENKAGSFDAPRWLPDLVNPSDPPGHYQWAYSVALRDIDGDRDPDILTASSTWPSGPDPLSWYESLGGGEFDAPRVISEEPWWQPGFDTADLDGDGDMDVLSRVGFNELAWFENTSGDCNGNAVPDECEMSFGTAADCNLNLVPDACDIASDLDDDCNRNRVPDSCDLIDGSSDDCNANFLPDECEPDCDGNGVADSCDIAAGASDCNLNFVPDECELSSGKAADCNDNGVPDDCDIAGGLEGDCNDDGVPDDCELASGSSDDCNGNGVPDSCDVAVTFTAQTLPAWGGRVIAVADVDADGFLDVVQCGPAALGWVRNLDGAGSFGPLQLIDPNPWILWSFQCLQAVVTDLERDRDLLIAYMSPGNYQGTIVRYTNLDGQGTFGPRIVVESIPDARVIRLAASDLDGDGDDDLAWNWSGDAGEPSAVKWRRNLFPWGLDDAVTVSSDGPFFSVLAADVDGDDDNDLVTSYGWFRNTGWGAFGPKTSGPNSYLPQSAVDLDGDGDLDILDAGNWYENLNGAGNFGPGQDTIEEAFHNALPFDINGDGLLDLLAFSTLGSDGVYWYEHLEGGVQFGPAQLIEPLAGDATAADIDRDGDLDVVTPRGWFRNDTMDRDGNGVPDSCETHAPPGRLRAPSSARPRLEAGRR